MIRNTGEWKWVSGVGVMGDGSWAVSSAYLVSVPYIRLPKTRPKDVFSMHKCYTHFLLMLSKAWCHLCFFSINDIKRGGVRAGDVGGGTGRDFLPSQHFFKFFGRDIQSGQRVRQMCKPDTGVSAWFAWQGSPTWNFSLNEVFLTATNEICR